MIRTILTRPKRESCIGDMRDRIKLHIREIQSPEFSSQNFTEKFSGTKEVWANVKTVVGRTLFTGANIDVALTHEIIIRYDEDVTSETWIEFQSNNLKIVTVEDLDNRHDFMRLKCTERGDKDLGAAQA